MDIVDVGSRLARVHDGIDSCESDATGALHTPKGMGAADEAGRGGDQRLPHVDVGISMLE